MTVKVTRPPINLREKLNEIDKISLENFKAMDATFSGNVGIGTDTPKEKLVVKGDGARITVESADMEVAMLGRRGSSGSALDSGYLRLRRSGVTTDGIVLDTDGPSWLNGGNVGIGTSSPSTALQVGDGTGTANWLRLIGTVSDLYIGQNTALAHFGQTNAAKLISSANYPIALGTANAYPVIFGTADTERMRIDGAGNVGIGVVPSASWAGNSALQLSPKGSFTSSASFGAGVSTNLVATTAGWGTNYLDAGAASAYLQATSDGSHRFYTAPVGTAGAVATITERMRIDGTTGNVGIGNSIPNSFNGGANNLVVGSGSGAEGMTIYGGAESNIFFADGTVGSDALIGRIEYSHISEVMRFYVNNSNAMNIDSSGRVGIGGVPNTNWRNDLANQEILMLGTEATLFSDGGVTTELWNNAYIDNTDVIFNISTRAAARYQQYEGTHKWWTAASAPAGSNINTALGTTPKMTLDVSGNLMVGTSTNYAKLAVRTNGSTIQGLSVTGDTAGDTIYTIAQFGKFDNNTTTSQVFINFTVNNGAVASGQINANGAGAVAFGSWSDRRLKENITDLPSQLANITALRPVEFDYIESEGGEHQIGFVAQEVEEIYPDLVGERQDGMKTLSGMGKMEARLIKAIQEQQATIEALTARIAALES